MEKETNKIGNVTLFEYAEFFSFSTGGKWAILLIIVSHILINGCAVGVSLYLSFYSHISLGQTIAIQRHKVTEDS